MDTDTILVADNALISVWIHPARRMVHHRMKTYCHGEDFRAGLTRGLEAMERYRATKWLSDDRSNGALVPEDSAWTARHWVPRAKAAGWRHWSIVQPAKIIGQLSMERVLRGYTNQGINVRMFGDPDEAMRWLVAQ